MTTQDSALASASGSDGETGPSVPARAWRAVGRWCRRYWPLLVVAAVGYAWRLVTILVLRPACPVVLDAGQGTPGFAPLEPPRCLGITGDSLFMYVQGQMIAEGHGFGHSFTWLDSGQVVPSAGKPPLYPLFLAVLNLVGIESIDQQRVASALFGAVAIVLLGLLAWRIAGRRAGIATAVVAALSPLLWINDGRLMVESLYVVMVAGLLLATYSFWEHPRPRTAAGVGVMLGLAILVRGETLMLAGLLVLPLVLTVRAKSAKARVVLAEIVLVCTALVMAPWVLRNLATFQEVTTTQFGTGMALLNGNCDAAYNDPEMLGLNNFQCFNDDEALGWIVELVRPQGRDESSVDQLMRARALDYMEAHADRLPAMVLYREGRMWELYRPNQNVEINWRFEDRGLPESWAALVAYYLTMPLAVAGLVVLRRRRVPIFPFGAVFLSTVIVAAITYGLARYRVPSDAVAVVLAGIAIDALITRLGRPAGPNDGLGRRRLGPPRPRFGLARPKRTFA